MTAPPGSPRLDRAANVAGHPSISWSIVLDAVPTRPVRVAEVRERLAHAWPPDGRAGPVPPVEVDRAERHLLRLAELADRPYAGAGPLCRVVVLQGEPSARVLVAGHHAVLDGMGLVAVLGASLGVPLGTDARGAGGARIRRSRLAYPMRRALEAVFAPPDRVCGDGTSGATSIEAARSGGDVAGDHLLTASVAAPITTVDLVVAAVAAVRAWNARHGAGGRRMVVAIGASRTPGSAPLIGRQALWFRIRIGDGDAEDVRAALRIRGPEPQESASMMRAANRAGASRLLEDRTGSTLLVSNLGRLAPDDAVAGAAFYPSAHGRSGIAVGGVILGDRTTITLRARRRTFSPAAARELVDLLASHAAASAA